MVVGEADARQSIPSLWRLLLLGLASVVVILCSSAPVYPQTQMTLTLVDNAVVLGGPTNATSDTLLLEAANVAPADLTAPLEVSDLVVSGTVERRVSTQAVELVRSGNKRTWVVAVEAPQFARDAVEQRYLRLKLGTLDTARVYELRGTPAPAFSWSISSSSSGASLRPGDPIDLAVAVSGAAATNVRLMSATFIESSTKRVVSGGWRLCRSMGETCEKDGAFSLDAKSGNRLYLIPEHPPVGHFTGTVTLGAAQVPAGTSMTVSFTGTTLCLQILGFVALTLGVALSWVGSVWLANRINRAQMLRPAAALGDEARALAERYGRLRQDIRNASKKTGAQIGMLQRDALARELDKLRLIPSQIPSFRGGAAEGRQNDYQAFLTEKGLKLQQLAILVELGFEPLNNVDAGQLTTALPFLDDISQSNESSEKQREKILQIVQPFQLAAGRRRVTRSPTTKELLVEIDRLNMAGWLLFALIALAFGSAATFLSNPGFGVPLDFLYAFLWGFGLPAGAKLAESTMANVRSSLGVTLS